MSAFRFLRRISVREFTQDGVRSTMQEIETREYAEQLQQTHGDKAIVVAVKKARSSEEKGDVKQAKTWRHIEAALKVMRGPHQS